MLFFELFFLDLRLLFFRRRLSSSLSELDTSDSDDLDLDLDRLDLDLDLDGDLDLDLDLDGDGVVSRFFSFLIFFFMGGGLGMFAQMLKSLASRCLFLSSKKSSVWSLLYLPPLLLKPPPLEPLEGP